MRRIAVRCSLHIGLAAALPLLFGCSLAAAATASVSAEDNRSVDCKLPPQLRQLGQNATYLAPGRIVQTTIADCKVRGGEYHVPESGAVAGPGALAGQPVPVSVGGDKSRAACPEAMQVVGLKAGGSLSVRSGPATSYSKFDALVNGRAVFVCMHSPDGAWAGIVYPRQAGAACGVSQPIRDAQPYRGACASGWVSGKYVAPKR